MAITSDFNRKYSLRGMKASKGHGRGIHSTRDAQRTAERFKDRRRRDAAQAMALGCLSDAFISNELIPYVAGVPAWRVNRGG